MRIHSIKKFNPVLILGILLLFVNNFPGLGESFGKQLATISLMGIGLSLLLLYRPHSVSLNNIPFFILFIYTFYVIINNLVHIYLNYDGLLFNDLAEPLRVFSIMLFFIIGASSHSKIRLKNINSLFLIYLGLSIILLIGWFVGGIFRMGIYDFYITRGGRFSGLFASVNYIWVSTIIIIGLGLLYFNKVKVDFFNWWIIAFVSFISLLSLALSGGRASIIGFLLGIFVITLFGGKKSRRITYTFGIIIVFVGAFVFHFASDYIFLQLGRTIDRITELYIAMQYIDLSQVAAFDARLRIWTRAWAHIQENLIFGHGSNKSGLTFIDNTYLMSLYRYGIIGLFLEISLYISFVWICIRRMKFNTMYALPLSFMVAYTITGITSAPFYELKTPYILAFLMGWFTTVDPKFEGTRKFTSKK